jgi:hydrogenase maturation protease
MMNEISPDCPVRIKILYAGIGNLLRTDDGVGVRVCEGIIPNEIVDRIIVEASIENYIGKINNMAPDLLILIDCVDFGKTPGFFRLIPAEKLFGTMTNTHNISLKNISTLFNMPVWVLGIQPCSIKVGEGLTPEIESTTGHLIRMINTWSALNFSPVHEKSLTDIPV